MELEEVEQLEPEQSAEPKKARKQMERRKLVYTPSEVANELNVTRRTVYNWITNGDIPAFKVGVKLWGVRAHVVEALAEGRDVWRAEAGYLGALAKKENKADSAIFTAILERIKKPMMTNQSKSSATKKAGTARPASASTPAKNAKSEPETNEPETLVPAASDEMDYSDLEAWGTFGPDTMARPASGVLAPMKNAGVKKKPAKGRRN